MTVWRDVRPGDRVVSVCGPGVVDSVEVTPFAVFARVDGHPYILSPDEVVHLLVPEAS